LLSKEFVTRVHIDQYMQERALAPKVAVEANTISALVESCATARSSPSCCRRSRNVPGLRNVALKPALPARTVMLLRRKDAYQSAAARACMEIILRDAARWGR
jgi:LysR family cyn operon transcriptional activator